MKLNQLEYTLPDKNIAHSPTLPRDHAKLLLLDKHSGKIAHKHFFDLPNILGSNDVLVFNDTKVFPARLFSGKTEILLLREIENNVWTAMHRGKIKVGESLDFGEVHADVLDKKEYEITIKFNEPKETVLQFLETNGQMPLPPYIHASLSESDIREQYQTVYAKENGSVAAPTAGLHFTNELIENIKGKGVQVEYVTLHVGAGTFLPIKNDDLSDHNMHSEFFSVNINTLERLNEAKKNGKRIIAVGTTTCRVLESLADTNNKLKTNVLNGETDIFIFPPYRFKFIDALITNFHLPHSTLLALISAFVSAPNTENEFKNFEESIVGAAYNEVIKNDYKFYSFGDGMMIG